MIKISFNYDPDTNTVSGIAVEGADVKAAKAKPAPKAKAKTKVSKVVLNGSSLQLNENVLALLGLEVGDRVCVRFNPGPVLVTPEAAKEPKGGNLITKSLTVSVKGKTGDTLKEHGTEFEYTLVNPGFVALEDNVTPLEAEEDKPVNNEIDSVIDDEDFLSTIEDGEEVDFTIDQL